MTTQNNKSIDMPKKIYQQWWFWLISVGALIIIIIGIAYSPSNNKNKTSTTETTEAETKVETETAKIEVPDFSGMTKDQIIAWANDNSVKVDFPHRYSDTVPKDGYIEQSPAAGETISQDGNIHVTISYGKEPTTGESNALKKAESYLKSMAFSRSRLISQLEYEGYSTSEATYAVDNITVDWNEQAAKKAESYLKSSAFSRDKLIQQLEYEGFTHEQAEYGVSQNGY